MRFAYEVKYHGVYYPAGTEVPIGKTAGAKKAPAEKSGKVDKKDEAPIEKTRKYSDEELNLPYMKLKSLAVSEGLKVEKSAKADEIKEMLRKL